MIGVQGTFYFGEKGTKTFGVDISAAGSLNGRKKWRKCMGIEPT